MKPEKSRTAAFSGHRTFKINGGGSLFDPVGGYGREAIAQRLHETVRKLATGGYTDFLCGMAEGFDLMAGEAVVAVRREFPQVRLTAVIPFPEQAARFGGQTHETYDRVLAAADHTLVVCPEYSADCFHRRNDLLVDRSSVLVCYYNGSPGGTQYTVKRALQTGTRVINLAPF